MTVDVVELLLETLRLPEDADTTELRRRWSAATLSGVTGLVEYEGCVLLLYQRLKELRVLDAVPAPFAQWLSRRAHRLAAHNLVVDAQRDELVQLLNELRVPHVLLKGAARRLLAAGSARLAARTTTDVDVLVPEDAARPTWVRLQTAGFLSAPAPESTYDRHFHLPPLRRTRAVAVELHTSTSYSLPAEVAWQRIGGSARSVLCNGGPTQVPAATELLWHAITHVPLPSPDAFRFRYFQDIALVDDVAADVDWNEIAARFASPELPHKRHARRWLGTALRLTGLRDMADRLGALPPIDLSRALKWRLAIFRRLEPPTHDVGRHVWGPQPVSRLRRLLIEEATCSELRLPHTTPAGTTGTQRAARRVAAAAARLCYHSWRAVRYA